MYHYYMNLLLLYVCVLFSYVLTFTSLYEYVLTSWAYIPCMGVLLFNKTYIPQEHSGPVIPPGTGFAHFTEPTWGPLFIYI
jgi:hypothetical protein